MISNSEIYDTLIYPILDSITKEYECEWVIVKEFEDGPETLRIRFTDRKNDTHLSYLFNLRAIINAYEPSLAFSSEVRNALEEWKRDDRNRKYRDILVEQIKSAGQQLIDRAEEMVSEKLAYVTDFSISIDIPQPADRPVSISWTAETVDTNQLK